jgi:hypothetical protein
VYEVAMSPIDTQVISLDALPLSNIAREFVGADHGAEVFLVHEGGVCA